MVSLELGTAHASPVGRGPTFPEGCTMTGSDREREVLESVPRQLYIGGEWRPASGGGTLSVEDPATGKPLVAGARADGADRLAARRGAAGWRGGGRPKPSGPRTRRASAARS